VFADYLEEMEEYLGRRIDDGSEVLGVHSLVSVSY
jgi:hypothetical protein